MEMLEQAARNGYYKKHQQNDCRKSRRAKFKQLQKISKLLTISCCHIVTHCPPHREREPAAKPIKNSLNRNRGAAMMMSQKSSGRFHGTSMRVFRYMVAILRGWQAEMKSIHYCRISIVHTPFCKYASNAAGVFSNSKCVCNIKNWWAMRRCCCRCSCFCYYYLLFIL